MFDLKREDGYALVLTIVIVAVLMIFVGIMSRLIDNELGFYTQNKSSSRAFYAAEAGIAYGTEIYKYETSPINNVFAEDYLEDAQVSNLSWSSITYDSMPAIKFESVGSSNGVTRTISSIYSTYNSLFDNAITVDGDFTLDNSHIISDGNISVGGTLIGEINNEDGEIIEPIEPSEDYSIPTWEYIYFENLANDLADDGEDVHVVNEPSVDYDYDDLTSEIGDIGDKFVCIDGNFTIDKATINGSGVLVVNGKLTLGTNISINQDPGYENDFYSIIVLGDGTVETLSIEGKNNIEIRGFIYSNYTTTLKNQFDLTGALVSRGNLTFKNSNASEKNIDYDSGFIDVLYGWGISFPDDVNNLSNKSLNNLLNWSEN